MVIDETRLTIASQELVNSVAQVSTNDVEMSSPASVTLAGDPIVTPATAESTSISISAIASGGLTQWFASPSVCVVGLSSQRASFLNISLLLILKNTQSVQSQTSED